MPWYSHPECIDLLSDSDDGSDDQPDKVGRLRRGDIDGSIQYCEEKIDNFTPVSNLYDRAAQKQPASASKISIIDLTDSIMVKNDTNKRAAVIK